MLTTELLWAFSAGAFIGVIYFASMRWTVARLVRARQPIIWLLGGATVRIALVLPLFYIVMAAEWQRMLACLVGFVVGRIVSTRVRGAMPAAPTAG